MGARDRAHVVDGGRTRVPCRVVHADGVAAVVDDDAAGVAGGDVAGDGGVLAGQLDAIQSVNITPLLLLRTLRARNSYPRNVND